LAKNILTNVLSGHPPRLQDRRESKSLPDGEGSSRSSSAADCAVQDKGVRDSRAADRRRKAAAHRRTASRSSTAADETASVGSAAEEGTEALPTRAKPFSLGPLHHPDAPPPWAEIGGWPRYLVRRKAIASEML
jgi:hypothetical protein